VKTSGTALVTDMTEALSLALAGASIAYVPEPLARRSLRDESLEWLLPQTAVAHDGLFLYYPRRASLAPKLRAFIAPIFEPLETAGKQVFSQVARKS
jgi:DNA-binding transcriptional LysR family regulator